ncbi:MAG: hypothetical protein ACOZCL_11375 [Bacillota bacterium]
MSNIKILENENIPTGTSIENAATEAIDLIKERANTSAALLKSFKEKNTGIFNKLMNRKQAEMIGKAEVGLIVSELEAQKQELEALHTGRLKALQKVLETKIMHMNSILHVDLSSAYKEREAILLRNLNEGERIFQEIIETFEERILTYKNEAMRKRALENLEKQIESFYNSKEKLIEEYSNLIENLKFPTNC